MLLNISDNHKQHLSIFENVSDEVLQEFCRISLDFITKGVNVKLYQSAAQKLEVDVTAVQNGVQGLMNLFIEASKLMVSDIDFHDSVMMLGFSEAKCKHLLQVYTENRMQIRAILSEMTLQVPEYFNLEWRFDVQLASRTLRHQITPVILLKLHTTEGDKKDSILLQTDPVNLLHLTQSLEDALNELKTAHCRRIIRNL